jgi:hypothetical protein
MPIVQDKSGNGHGVEQLGSVKLFTPKDSYDIAPDDDTDLPRIPRAIVVDGGGDLAVITADGTAQTYTLPAGGTLRLQCIRVKATGTTATGIHAQI